MNSFDEMKKIGFIPLLALVLVGCCKAAAPRLNVKLEDAVGNNLLNNAQSTDSTWVLYDDPQDWQMNGTGNPNMIDVVSSADGNVLNFESFSLNSNQTYYLKIDSTDLDTINIVFDIKGTSCSPKTKVSQITYNNNVFLGGKKDETATVIKY